MLPCPATWLAPGRHDGADGAPPGTLRATAEGRPGELAVSPAPALSRRREVGEASARSLLITVLGEYVLPRRSPVWTSVLVQALGLLGVAEKSARQALARSAGEGWVSSARFGRRVRWELTGPGQNLLTEGARRIYSFGRAARSWDGRWLLLLASVPDSKRELRHRLRTQLAWAGFGALAAGVWVSPDPGREAEARSILAGLGLADTAMSFLGSYGSVGTPVLVARQAWDLDGGQRPLPGLHRRVRQCRPGDRRRLPGRADPAGARLAPVPVPRPAAARRPAAQRLGRDDGRAAVRVPARGLAAGGAAALGDAGGRGGPLAARARPPQPAPRTPARPHAARPHSARSAVPACP